MGLWPCLRYAVRWYGAPLLIAAVLGWAAAEYHDWRSRELSGVPDGNRVIREGGRVYYAPYHLHEPATEISDAQARKWEEEHEDATWWRLAAVVCFVPGIVWLGSRANLHGGAEVPRHGSPGPE